MSDTPGDNSAVEQLLAERDALHGWIARLDAASVTASEAVRERVRHDYQQRLDLLTSALREHGDAIAARLSADLEEQAELSARTETSRDALAEVELRHAVGEFPHDRYQSEQRRHLSDIEACELSLAAVNERIARMDEVLTLVRREPRAPELEPLTDDTAAEPMSIHDLAPAEAIEQVESMEVIEPVGIGQLAPEDDTDQYLSVFAPEEQTSTALVQPSESAPATPIPGFGPLSFRPSAGAPAREPTPIGLPADAPPRFIRPGERLSPSAPSRPAVAPVAAAPIVEPVPEIVIPAPAAGLFGEEIVASGPVTPPAASVGRTLRCGECGAMNRPLEWYCEKCGAELTAV